MKKSIIVCLMLVVLGGCKSIDDEFVLQADRYTSTIMPDYKLYLDADITLDADTKRIRKQTADSFLMLIEEAKKDINTNE